MSNTLLAIDIGSSKISSVIATISDTKEIFLEGSSLNKAKGIQKGLITDVKLASEAIKLSIDKAQIMADSTLSSAIVSISHAYTKNVHSEASIEIVASSVNINDIEEVIKIAIENAQILPEYEIIHTFPTTFTLDNEKKVKDPIEMDAQFLEVNLLIVLAEKSYLSKLRQAILSAGVEIDTMVINGYASMLATTDEEERASDFNLVDLGAQTSNLIIYKENSIVSSDYLAVGSNHITNDLSIALKTPLKIAQKLKHKYVDLDNPTNDIISLPLKDDEENFQDISLEFITLIVRSRVEETLKLLKKSLEAFEEKIPSKIIITGGMTKLTGFEGIAQEIFSDMNVVIASPKAIDTLNATFEDPTFATLIGLLKYSSKENIPYEINFKEKITTIKEVPIEEKEVTMHIPEIPIIKEPSNLKSIFETDFDNVKTIEKKDSTLIKRFLNAIKKLV